MSAQQLPETACSALVASPSRVRLRPPASRLVTAPQSTDGWPGSPLPETSESALPCLDSDCWRSDSPKACQFRFVAGSLSTHRAIGRASPGDGRSTRSVKGPKIQAFSISPARQRAQTVWQTVRTSVVDLHQSESVARRGLSFTRCGEMLGLASGGEFVLTGSP
jgi:hypothetical protein